MNSHLDALLDHLVGHGPLFRDRQNAGATLAARLERYRGQGGLVLGLPRGGVVVAAEDARFAWHPGVDALAALRASAQLALNGRIVSGASTLTMQVARLLERHPHSLAAKLGEMARALALERVLRKDQVLGLYLTLAPFGGNLEGVRAASLAYFGNEPARLSAAECALLVVIPRSPVRTSTGASANSETIDRVRTYTPMPQRSPVASIGFSATLTAIPSALVAMPKFLRVSSAGASRQNRRPGARGIGASEPSRNTSPSVTTVTSSRQGNASSSAFATPSGRA